MRRTPATDEAWATSVSAETEVVEAILNDTSIAGKLVTGAYEGMSGFILTEDIFTGADIRPVAKAILSLARQDAPITIARIISEMGMDGDSDLRDYIQRLDDGALSSKVDALRANLERLEALAAARRMLPDLKSDLDSLHNRPYDALTLSAAISAKMGDVAARRAVGRDNSASAIIARGGTRKTALGTPIGIAWLDDYGDPAHGRPGMFGGICEGEKLLLQGLYGGRKTTTMVNICLHMMSPNRKMTDPITGEVTRFPPERIAYFMLDDNQSVLANWFIAQIATALMRKKGVPPSQWVISARGLDERLRSPEQNEAIMEATAIFSRLPLIIYDGEDGVHDWEVAQAKMREAVLLHGVTTIVHDYAQDFVIKSAPKIYEQMKEYTQGVNAFAGKHRTKFLITSQRNESTNASGSSGEAAGTKGGGDLPAKATYILQSRPFAKNPAIIWLDVLKSRWGAKNVSRWFTINPSSGAFLDNNNMEKQGEPPALYIG
jgi:hypothetical protein